MPRHIGHRARRRDDAYRDNSVSESRRHRVSCNNPFRDRAREKASATPPMRRERSRSRRACRTSAAPNRSDRRQVCIHYRHGPLRRCCAALSSFRNRGTLTRNIRPSVPPPPAIALGTPPRFFRSPRVKPPRPPYG